MIKRLFPQGRTDPGISRWRTVLPCAGAAFRRRMISPQGFRIGVRKKGSLFRKPVHVRSTDPIVSIHPHIVGSKGIDDDEDQVHVTFFLLTKGYDDKSSVSIVNALSLVNDKMNSSLQTRTGHAIDLVYNVLNRFDLTNILFYVISKKQNRLNQDPEKTNEYRNRHFR